MTSVGTTAGSGIMLKFKLDSTRQKELVVVVLILLTIGLAVWWQWGWWTGGAPRTIAEFTYIVPHGADMDHPVSVKNPIDGAHTELRTTFAANAGTVNISKFPQLAGQYNIEFKPRVATKARRPGRFGDAYQLAQKQSGAARQMVTWACYSAADGQSWAFALRAAEATAEQNRAIRAIAGDLRDGLRTLAASKADGSFQARELKQLQDMLDAYNKLPGNPANDPNSPKAALAWKIFQAGQAYASGYDKARDALILGAADKMLKVFDSGQQDKLAAAAQHYADQAQARAGG